MNYPPPLGPLAQLMGASDTQYQVLMKDWHRLTINGSGNGRDAGSWCMENIKGRWSFIRDFTLIHFFIEEGKDAMLFKLTWHLELKPKSDK